MFKSIIKFLLGLEPKNDNDKTAVASSIAGAIDEQGYDLSDPEVKDLIDKGEDRISDLTGRDKDEL